MRCLFDDDRRPGQGETIAAQLRAMGIRTGDTVLARGSTRRVGPIPGPGRQSDKLVAVLLSVLGPDGTLVGLSFTRTCLFPGLRRGRAFDRYAPAATGGLINAMLRRPDAKRSLHPTNSFVAIGRRAEAVVRGHDETADCFAPMRRLVQLDAWMLTFGVGPQSQGFSTVHLAQLELGLSRRTILSGFTGARFLRPDGSVGLFRKRDVPGCSRGFGRFYPLYERDGSLNSGHVGNAPALAARTRRTYPLELAALKRDPTFALCDDPACFFCRGTLLYNLRDWPAYYFRHAPSRLASRLVSRLRSAVFGHLADPGAARPPAVEPEARP